MIIGTTPTHIFSLPFATSLIGNLRILYSQDGTVVVTKTLADCELSDNTVTVTWTQADTFKLNAKKPVEVQLRVLTTTGTAIASIPKRFGVTRCFETEVLE